MSLLSPKQQCQTNEWHISDTIIKIYYFSYKDWEYCKTLNVHVPLIPLFHELNKTAKLKDVNINTVPTLIGISRVLELCGLNSPK